MNRKAIILSVVGILMIIGATLGTKRGQTIVKALSGNRSTVAGASVTLAWSPSLSSGAVGNRLHYGTQQGTYDQVLDVGNQTNATASNLSPGTQYFFAATAYDSTGNESSFSNEVAYRPASPTPGPTGTPGPSPTASPPRTPSPTPGAIGITLNPNPLNFVGVPNVQPTPQSVQITTSNGAAWTSRDVLTWLDTGNPTGMPSGSVLTVKPNAGLGAGTYNGDITITATGLTAQLLHVKLVVGSVQPTATPRPTLTPAPTASPSPTIPPSPSPSVSPAPSASPSCTPCLCGK